MPTVYAFKRYDITTDKEVVSRFKATADRIKEIDAVAIEGTEQHVELFELDDDGIYNPDA